MAALSDVCHKSSWDFLIEHLLVTVTPKLLQVVSLDTFYSLGGARWRSG